MSFIKIGQDGLTIGEEINLKRLVFDHELGSSFKKKSVIKFSRDRFSSYLAAKTTIVLKFRGTGREEELCNTLRMFVILDNHTNYQTTKNG